MANIRRALVFASAGRYAARAVNLAMTVAISRMMGPKEFGIAVLGGSAFLILEAIREVASVNYLVQQPDLTREKINSAFTVSFAITVILTIAIVLLAHPIAALYGEARLANYIHVVTLGFALGPFMQPLYALWSRELAFRTIAFIDVLGATITAVVSIILVWLGFGYMGLAWATAMSSVTGVSVALWLRRRELAIFRFSLKEWRSVLSFGLYGSATAIVFRVSDAFAYMVFGKLLSPQGAGLMQRSVTLAGFPETVILSGVGAIALPAFSHEARSGADLKKTYLSAVALVTAVQWPAMAFVCTMATPLTLLALGPRWTEVAPLAQILAFALMFNFASSLNFPALVAVGAIRNTLPTALLQVVLCQIILVWAATFGIKAVAMASLVTVPLGLVLWMSLVRVHIPFSLGELFVALRKSFIVLLCSSVGPVAVLIYRNGAPSIMDAAMAGALWAMGWLLAIGLTRHPLLNEMTKAGTSALRRLQSRAGA